MIPLGYIQLGGFFFFLVKMYLILRHMLALRDTIFLIFKALTFLRYIVLLRKGHGTAVRVNYHEPPVSYTARR